MTLEVESSTVLLLNSHHVHSSAFNFLCLKSIMTLPHILDIVPNPLYGLQDPPWSSMCLSRLISLFFHYSLCSHNLGILSVSKLFLSAHGIISLKTATRYQRQSSGYDILFNSVQFSRSAVSNSLWPREPQHARPPCPSPTPGVHPNSCPLSQWCHPTISSSVLPFFSCPQSFPASGSFQMSQFFTSGGQSIGVSASTSVLPMNTQDWSPLGWTDWISLQSKGLSRVFSNTTVQKHQFFGAQLSL